MRRRLARSSAIVRIAAGTQAQQQAVVNDHATQQTFEVRVELTLE